MQRLLLLILLMLSIAAAKAQPPKDTSFTVYSAYKKELKKRPYISIANPLLPRTVEWKHDVVYSTPSPGRHLTADICMPRKREGGVPVVILIHGGGWRSGDKTMNRAMAVELAKNGYAAMSIEYRLSGEAPFPAAFNDVQAAIAWVQQEYDNYSFCKNKIALVGVSAGGQLASLVGTINKAVSITDTSNASEPLVQAVVNIDGVLAFKHPESRESSAAAAWLGGTYEQAPDKWKLASALEHVNGATASHLFLNSSQPRFHAGRDDMIQKLNELGIYSEVHTFNDTPHTFWLFDPWFSQVMDKMVLFLKKQFSTR